MQLYWSGGAYGFLDGAWAGWDIRKAVNGNLEAWVGSGGFICACEGGVKAATCVVAGTCMCADSSVCGAQCVKSPILCATSCVRSCRGEFGGGTHTLESTEAVIRMCNSTNNHNYIVSNSAGWSSWQQWIRYSGSVNTWRIGTYDCACTTGNSLWRLAGKARSGNAEINYIVAGPRTGGGTDRDIFYCPYARTGTDWTGSTGNVPIGAGGIVCGTTAVCSPTLCGTTAVCTALICATNCMKVTNAISTGFGTYCGLGIGADYVNQGGWHTQLNMYGSSHVIARWCKSSGDTADNAQCGHIFVHNSNPFTIYSSGNMRLCAAGGVKMCLTSAQTCITGALNVTGNICSAGLLCTSNVICTTSGGWSVHASGNIYSAGCIRAQSCLCSNGAIRADGALHAGANITTACCLCAAGHICTPNHFYTGSNHNARTVPSRFYASQDGYIRYYDRCHMKGHLGLTSRYDTSRTQCTTDTNYWMGTMGWGAQCFNSAFTWGSGMIDLWSNPGQQPSGTSHWQGVQALHYSCSQTGTYGFQLVVGAGNPALMYVRGSWGGGPGSWSKMWNESNDGAGSGLDADKLDGQQGSYYYAASNPSGYTTASGFTLTGDIVSNCRSKGVFGTYNSTLTDQIWSMGTAYRNHASGTNFGNLYGLAYKHTNNSTGGNMGGGHQMVWAVNGAACAALGESGIWSGGYVCAANLVCAAGTSGYTLRTAGCIYSNSNIVAASGIYSSTLCATSCVQTPRITNLSCAHNTGNYLNLHSSCNNAGGNRFYDLAGNTRGYIYWDGTANFGVLSCAGGWGLRIAGDSTIYLCKPTCVVGALTGSTTICATTAVCSPIVCANGSGWSLYNSGCVYSAGCIRSDSGLLACNSCICQCGSSGYGLRTNTCIYASGKVRGEA